MCRASQRRQERTEAEIKGEGCSCKGLETCRLVQMVGRVHGEGYWTQTPQSPWATLPQSLCPDVDGAGAVVRPLGPLPCNRGPVAHFQSGPVPSTEAELIKHSLPFSKEMESNLLLEQLVYSPAPSLPSSRPLLIPHLHHFRLCLPSIS